MTKKQETAPWELKELPVAPAEDNSANTDHTKIIRKYYREPIFENDRVCAEINGRTYMIYDIGNLGVSIIAPSFGGFLPGAVHTVTLHLSNTTISLQGTIAHVSPLEASGDCRCGIKFTDLSPKDEQVLEHFLTAHHARLFGGTSSHADLGWD